MFCLFIVFCAQTLVRKGLNVTMYIAQKLMQGIMGYTIFSIREILVDNDF